MPGGKWSGGREWESGGGTGRWDDLRLARVGPAWALASWATFVMGSVLRLTEPRNRMNRVTSVP